MGGHGRGARPPPSRPERRHEEACGPGPRHRGPGTRHATLPKDQHEARALEALEWVGMAEARDRLPADLSGGMKKRVGLARAIVARPHLLFLDEPSAGLDPISSVKLDRLILDIRERTEAAIVIVTHELPSIYALADDGIFLDAEHKRPFAHGKPTLMRDTVMHPTVQAFMRREEIDTL